MKDLKIHFLNTIWSDAAILEKNGHFAFVDTASKFYYPMICGYMKELNINHLDFIILTHFHSDHYGNLANIIRDYKVDTLYIKHYLGHEGSTGDGGASSEETIKKELANYKEIIDAAKEFNVEIKYLNEMGEYDTTIDFEGETLYISDLEDNLDKIYNDETSEYYHKNVFNENFNSISIFIKKGENNIFLGADVMNAGSEVPYFCKRAEYHVKHIYEKYKIDHIDLYKSCHHGGGGTNQTTLTDLLKARYVIITNTDKWLNNWPTRDNLRNSNKDVEILQTDHYRYVFTINDSNMSYEKINDESLFIILCKD